MVSILPNNARSPFSVIGQDVGRAMQSVISPDIRQGMERQRGLGAIDQLQKDLAESGGDISKMLPALARAYTLNPNLERSGLGDYALQMAKAKMSENLPVGGETSGISRDRTSMPQQTQREQLPAYLNQQKQVGASEFFPTNIGAQGGPGNVPQAATSGNKRPILSRDEKIPAAKKLAAERNAAGIPTTVKEALKEIDESQKDDIEYNKEVDKELTQRVKGQQTYGDRAVDYLKGVLPEKTTPEMEAIFQKKGEEASKNGWSEADINRYLSNEAKLFKNAIVNAEAEVGAPRLFENMASKINGNYKDFEKAANDIQKHLQPLIDLGLYDTARELLRKKGYGVEEREAIIHPLSNQSKSIVNQITPLRHSTDPRKDFKKPPADLSVIKDALIQMKQVDPNFSPVLARKLFQDKGYDWKDFGNSWNELVKKGFELEGDQSIQSGKLDTPPLNMLDELLQGLNLIGR